jgi:hypothetical protein
LFFVYWKKKQRKKKRAKKNVYRLEREEAGKGRQKFVREVLEG